MKPYRILIVEDDDLMQNVLRDALRHDSFQLTFTSDGQEGWTEFQKNIFDLVLLDMKLPKIGGITLLKKMKQTLPEIIIIMMTAFGTVESAVEAMKNGAYDYITKPFLSEELSHLVEKALEFQDLKNENILLKQELDQRYSLGNIVGKSKAIREIYKLIETVAPTSSTVLIQGESGTGKELVAEALHHLSPRKNRPLIKVSCASLHETLLESELFGHEKGAFTDAFRKKVGRFELAHKGSLFLDDIDDMSPVTQVKLLRVLQERTFERVGGTERLDVDVRVIAASKVNLKDAVLNRTFREDLFYRLNVVPISLPPLRERKEDIPMLVRHFQDKISKRMNKKISIETGVIKQLVAYDWPGNIRELENTVERLIALSVTDVIKKEDLTPELTDQPAWKPTELKNIVKQAEKGHIRKVLSLTNGKKKEAAAILGITPKTLWEKIKLYKI